MSPTLQPAPTQTKRYNYPLYPTGEQARLLDQVFHGVRWCYNWYLDEHGASRNREWGWARLRTPAHADRNADTVEYRLTKAVVTSKTVKPKPGARKVVYTPSTYDMGVILTQRRGNARSKNPAQRASEPGLHWLSVLPRRPLIGAFEDAKTAYDNWFQSMNGTRKGRAMGSPRYKSRKDGEQSARWATPKDPVVKRENHWIWLELEGLKDHDGNKTLLKVRLTRPLPSKPSSVTIIRHADGTWEASMVVQCPVSVDAPEARYRACGIDMGVIDFFVLVHDDGTGMRVAPPRFLRDQLDKLAKLQKRWARMEKGSNNWVEQKQRIAKLHAHIARQRKEWLIVLAQRVVDEHEVICLETLNVQGMAAKRKAKKDPNREGAYLHNGRSMQKGMSRAVLDSGWGMFVQLVHQFAKERGREVRMIGRWEPSSQTCSVCGRKDGRKPLSVRAWECQNCGAKLDRDANAAMNIMRMAGAADRMDVSTRLQGASGTRLVEY